MGKLLRTTILVSWLLTACECGAAPTIEFGPVAFSPDGKFIVFSYSRDSSCFLYKAALKDGIAKRLTRAKGGCERSPAYSPDGKLIAYSYAPSEPGKGNIYLVSSNGGNGRHLVASIADDTYPIFAPEGTTIYFARSRFFGNYDGINRDRPHEWDVFSLRLDGNLVKEITNGNFYEMSAPSISKDGRSLIFEVFEEGIQIYSLSDAVLPPTVLQPHVSREDRSPLFGDVWYMPDGKSILFMAASVGSQGSYDYDVFRMPLGGGQLEKLTSANGYSDGVRPSPDGKTAIFVKNKLDSEGTPLDNNDLYLLDLKTRELKPLKMILPE